MNARVEDDVALHEELQALSVALRLVPEQFRRLVDEEAPARARMAVASGMVPMPSLDLVTSLCLLASDKDTAVAEKAHESLDAMDEDILIGVARTTGSPAVLHELARVVSDKDTVVETVLLNRRAHDETFHHIAQGGSGRALDIIANNQVRITRYPAIVEGLYFNPETPMAMVARVLETCVRQGVDIKHLPGHEEVVQSILGVRTDDAEEGDDAEAAVVPKALPDDEYTDLLKAASDEARAGMGGSVNWNQLQDMSIGQKVRLALMGNTATRNLLVRDSRLVVAMAVLKSPKLTEKEIADYARNKTLSDSVIREICQRRDWIKAYDIKKSLVHNPKCPPDKALRLLSFLTERDLRALSKNKEIPTYIMHAATRLVQLKEDKRNRKKKKK